MYRRVVSLLLLPSLLHLQQLSLGHTHGGSQPAGHDLVPHFHAHIFHEDHDECGHHPHPDADHHDHDDDDDDDAPDFCVSHAADSEPSSDHDSTAVFISVDQLVGERCPIGEDLGWVTWIATTPGDWLDAWLGTHDHCARCRPPPSQLLSESCPLYFQHLAILI